MISYYIFTLCVGILIGVALERKFIRGGWSSKTYERLEENSIHSEASE